jgi:tryptophan synthase beta chain
LMQSHDVILLSLDDLPTHWYNVIPDLPTPLPPPRDPDQDDQSRIELLPRLFPDILIDQEFTPERWVQIPEELRRFYIAVGRPTPLCRARRLESRLNTSAQIYYKREDVSPTGSHKTNTALAQAYYAKLRGFEGLVTETGAGQWGSALALACSLLGLKCRVFMTRSSYLRKPYRRSLMEAYGADVIPSPSGTTEFGRKILAHNSDHPGSLGIAISEALEVVLNHDGLRYAVGSVMNFVMLHQSIIGLEVMKQLKTLDIEPDLVVGCVGGGSNFCGISLPLLGAKLRGEAYQKTRFVAVESEAVPRMTKGQYRYEHADTAGLLPLIKMYTVGKDHVPPPLHAAGLRYHGVAPVLSLLLKEGLVHAAAYSPEEVMETAKLFAQTEGIVPAPEAAHALRYAVDEAIRARKTGTRKVILVNLSGHGLLDLG